MAGRRLSLDDKHRLCDALLKIQAIHDPQLRNLYVTQLEDHLEHVLAVQRYSDVRHDVFSVVNSCGAHPLALRAFVRIVASFHPEDGAVRDVERLLLDLEWEPMIPEAARRSLLELLREVPADRVATAVQDVVEPTGRGSPPPWTDVESAVRHAELMTAADGGPPRLMAVFDRLAHGFPVGRSVALHRWIDEVGGGFGMDQAAIRTLCIANRQAIGDPRLSAPAEEESANVHEVRQTDISPDSPPPSFSPAGDAVITSPSTHAPPTPPGEQDEPVRLWGGVPVRNPDFTGREQLMRQLRLSLETSSKASVLPQTLHGMGGVGKTQLALEYVYRHSELYDLIWWIPSEQPSLALASLEELADRLGLPRSEDRKRTAGTVLDALASSRLRWLLVFDNASEPDQIAPLVPSAGGHVILTSRDQTWANVWDAIAVDVFDRDESVELVRKRGSSITEADADRLADKLGDLPLALDQAATWQAGTGMPVAEYLELFDQHVRELLSEGKPPSYPTTVAAFVSLAFERLRNAELYTSKRAADEALAVAQLLELFAYLGAEPVSVSMLRRGREAAVSEPLRRALREPIFLNRTIRQMRRYGLAIVGPDQTIQVHRLVALVVREGLTEGLAGQSRDNVHAILASANPGDPEDTRGWPAHAEIGPHVLPARVIESDNYEARQVALDQARYLFLSGDYEGARRLGELIVPAWQGASGAGLGIDGEQTLIAMRHLGNALRSLGEYKQASARITEAYERFVRQPEFGELHEHTVITGNGLGVDLRLAGDFAGALRTDREMVGRHVMVFGEDEAPTLRAKNNLAVNLRMLGDFAGALTIDEELLSQWQRTVGNDDPRTLFTIANVARDLYGLGRYAEALDLQSRNWPVFRDRLGARHIDVLLAARTIAISLRKVGRYPEALAQARDNYYNYHARFGPDHEHTLAATVSYANTLRVVGQYPEARTLAGDAVKLYEGKFGTGHPLTLTAEANLAIILRAQGELRRARSLDEATLDAMTAKLGAEHGYTLCVANNLANDRVQNHELAEAQTLYERTLEISRRVRGGSHPYTLACAANLALNQQATGDEAAGELLLAETVAQLNDILGAEHPETVDIARGKPADCDIEPPPT
ncbi:MAG TPA: FxSxx-COOH system tetratricopeptide repeat protein [Pilimelia sp.]|nr:FxSxx-COOH system tetratricopeptide repeat protein [Pilimelia sp.]